jgi:uncharacterized protein YkwD
MHKRILWIGSLAVAVWSGSAYAADPTNQEQLWLEIVNRMRRDPQSELQILTNINPGTPPTWATPKSDDPDVKLDLEFFKVDAAALSQQWSFLSPVAPLAWNGSLHAAAAGHNAVMIAQDRQGHQLPGELGIIARIEAAGYTGWNTLGENIFAFSQSVTHGHAGFSIDWGNGPGGMLSPASHRATLMSPSFREVGISAIAESNMSTDVGPLVVTQDFGWRGGNSFVTGVLYTDEVARDYFYTIGEGQGGIEVTAYLAGTDTVAASTTSSSSGGYALRLAPGAYDIGMSGPTGPRHVLYRDVVQTTANTKLDNRSAWMPDIDGNWNSSGQWGGGVPNGRGAIASLGKVTTARRKLTVETDIALGELILENTNGYEISGPGMIDLQRSDGNPTVRVLGAGHHIISAGLRLNEVTGLIAIDAGGVLDLTGPLTIGGRMAKSGAGVLNISGPQSHSANSPSLNVVGGEVNLFTDAGSPTSRNLGITSFGNQATQINFHSSQHLRMLSIDNAAGNAKLMPGGNKRVDSNSLSIDPLAKFDITDNAFVLGSSDLAGLAALIVSARGVLGTWDGPGLTSSSAASFPDGLTGLVLVLNKDSLGNKLPGYENLSDNYSIVAYSYNGDVNLDKVINIDDYLAIDSGFLNKASGVGIYNKGDFNLDQVINIDDYNLIDNAFLGQGRHPLLGAVSIPEPGMMGLGLVLLGLTRRIRRR